MSPFPELLDIENFATQTPLQLAVLTKQPRIIRYLRLSGANPEIRNHTGDTALHLACSLDDYNSAIALTEPAKSTEPMNTKIPVPLQNLEQRNFQGL